MRRWSKPNEGETNAVTDRNDLEERQVEPAPRCWTNEGCPTPIRCYLDGRCKKTGWRRLSEIVEHAFAGLVAGGGVLLLLAAIVYGSRVVGAGH